MPSRGRSPGLLARWRSFSMLPSIRPFTEWRVYWKWHRRGRLIPAPPIVKQRIVKGCLRRSGASTVVETGTFKGDMVDALAPIARRIVSIELDDQLYAAARRRFAGQRHIELVHGDSAALLPRILGDLDRPAFFWLDGHYTGAGSARTEIDSPILAEIEALLVHPVPGHVVLIDDAREFSGTGGYPTIDELRSMILKRQPLSQFSVADDIVRWTTHPTDRAPQGVDRVLRKVRADAS
jgi:hypothetical protein